MILVAVRKREFIAGRKIWEPATMWLGSTMAGLTASKSCQRRPLPRFCSASFQRESPVWTVTAFSFERPADAVREGAVTRDGAIGATGAAGWEGVTPRTDGFEGVGRTA